MRSSLGMNVWGQLIKLLEIRESCFCYFSIILLLSLRSYGKLGENVQRYSKIIIGTDDKLVKMKRSPFFKTENFLDMENSEHDSIEITMTGDRQLEQLLS